MIEQVDFLVRLIAIGAAMLLLAQLVVEDFRSRIKLPTLALILAMIARLIESAPPTRSASPAEPWVELVALSMPLWAWLLGRTLFERELPQRSVILASAVLVAAWFMGNFVHATGQVGEWVILFVSLALLGDLGRVVLRDRADDRNERRHSFGVWLALLMVLHWGTVVTGALVFAPATPPTPLRLIDTMVIVSLILIAGLTLLRIREDVLPGES